MLPTIPIRAAITKLSGMSVMKLDSAVANINDDIVTAGSYVVIDVRVAIPVDA